jgi:deoxycytidine triphosphate deaminase
MIVGKEIAERQLINRFDTKGLKNSTFDLSIGEIIPIGRAGHSLRRKEASLQSYVLDPREMVWILSEEEFNMPNDVTGLATLRTTFTQQGILALNVGVIDPFFKGPISTALINFSDVPRELKVGTPFFRVVFLGHDDVTEFHRREESRDKKQYLEHLERQSLAADFPQNFLNIPNFDEEHYAGVFSKMLWAWIKNYKKTSFIVGLFLAALLYCTWKIGIVSDVISWVAKFKAIKESLIP